MKKDQIVTTVLAILLIVSFVAVAFAVPTTNAAVSAIYSYIYVTTSLGDQPGHVGQYFLLVAWTRDMPPDIGETTGAIASPSGRAGWYGMTIKLTDPDNITTTLEMPYSDPVGANYISYTPEKAGTYYIQAFFPATWKNSTTSQTFYTAAQSAVDSFVVDTGAPSVWPESPLPDQYWQRPINAAARQWYVLASAWLGGAANVWPLGGAGGTVSNYAYCQAPETPHVLWSKPFSIGGLMDERTGTISYQTTHYQGTNFSPAVVLDGKIYYSPRQTTHGNGGLIVVDLYTGNTLYLNYSDQSFAFGQIYNYISPNQEGGFAYLWRTQSFGGGGGFFFGPTGQTITLPEIVRVANVKQLANLSLVWGNSAAASPTTVNTTKTPVNLGSNLWAMYDAWTMQPICYIANVSTTGTQVYGPKGQICYYNIVNKSGTYYLTVWNNTAGTMLARQDGTGYWQWRPAGGIFDVNAGWFGSYATNNLHDGNVFYTQNFTIPSIVGPQGQVGSIQCIRYDDYMIVGNMGWNTNSGLTKGWMECISIAPNASRGTKLWEMTYTPPYADVTKNQTQPVMFSGGMSLVGVYPEDNILPWQDVVTYHRWVYDLKSGELLWEATDPQLAYYGMSTLVYNHQLIAYGSFDGSLHSYDARTGQSLWNYSALDIGTESPYGNYPMSIGAVADGKIYTYTSEHHFIQPLWRGPNLRCINATDGKEIFRTMGCGGGMAISDGILIAASAFDNSIYAMGKGPSALSVSLGQDVTAPGSTVMIKGTITDQTATGRHNTNDDFDLMTQRSETSNDVVPVLKGTPCIGDDSMGAWMDYMYKQQIKPSNATGVPISIDVIDPNNNFFHVGDTVSDIYGNFALPYTPDVPGLYKVLVTFAGSKAYYPSYSTAYLNAIEPAQVTAQPTAEPVQSIADTYFIPAIIGVIVAIVAVGAVLALLMRKRP